MWASSFLEPSHAFLRLLVRHKQSEAAPACQGSEESTGKPKNPEHRALREVCALPHTKADRDPLLHTHLLYEPEENSRKHTAFSFSQILGKR